MSQSGPVLMIESKATTGGPRQTLAAFAAELSEHRPVTIATPPGPLVDLIRRSAPSAKVVLLPEWSENRVRAALQARPRLRELVAGVASNGGVIYASTESAFNLALPALAFARPKPRVLVHFHDSKPLRAKTVAQIQLARALGVRAVFAPVSEVARSFLSRARIHAGPTLPNPIARPPITAKWEGPPWSVAFVTKPEPAKGLMTLVDVAGRLVNTPIRWTVYGVESDDSSEHVGKCRRLLAELGIEDRVRWMGHVDDLQARFADHHALLLGSWRESFGRAALEGMAAGLPVVAGANDGVREAVGDAGLLFDLVEPSDGAQHLERLLADPEHFEKVQQAGLARAAKFAPDVVTARLTLIFDEISRLQAVASE